jgi:nicotinamidase-related amidase
MSKQAIIVVDIQNEYFNAGKLPLTGIELAAHNAARVIAAARRRDAPVIHIRHEFPGADAPFFAANSPGAEIHSSVEPLSGEPVIVKHYANAFRDTALKQILDDAGIEEVVIIGAMSHNCVDATARAAFDFGFATTVLHDACATLDLTINDITVPAAQVHAAFMAALAYFGKVTETSAYLSE